MLGWANTVHMFWISIALISLQCLEQGEDSSMYDEDWMLRMAGQGGRQMANLGPTLVG